MRRRECAVTPGRDINDAVDDGANMTLQTPTGEAAAELQCQLGGTEASPSTYAKLGPVPDLNNRRFCRACQTTLPVEAFPLGKRRYLCKRHTWLRLNKPSKERVLADPLKKLLWVLWKRCWNDAKTVFGHTRIALLQGDIAKVLSELESEGGGGNGAFFDKVKGAACDTVEPAKSAIAFLPENPVQLLSQENFVIVHMDVRRDMLRAYRDGGVERYGEALGKLV
jgi:hypothetical protein